MELLIGLITNIVICNIDKFRNTFHRVGEWISKWFDNIRNYNINTKRYKNYDVMELRRKVDQFVSKNCYFLSLLFWNKIVVYYFKGIANVIIHVLREYK